MHRSFFVSIILFLTLFRLDVAFGADKTESLSVIEKIAVFPVLYSGERGDRVDEQTAASLDETWWQVREELTTTGRFTVASRAFLQKADAFQPRGQLTAGDAVVLGRYVEADALLTLTLHNRNLTVAVFQSTDGALAWTQSVELHPSILLREQIAKVARALTREFIASLPYQGVTLQDSITRQATFNEGSQKHSRVLVATAQTTVGDPVQWVSVTRGNLKPVLQGGAKVEVIAEGVVHEVDGGTIVVNVTRVADNSGLRPGALVNLPKEQARLAKLAVRKDSATSAAVVSLLAAESAIEPEAKALERKHDERGPMATTLSILGSLAVILLLAF